MFVSRFLSILAVALIAFPLSSSASGGHDNDPNHKVTREEAKTFTWHHTEDSYKFEVAGYGFPLPCIIFDDGLKVFSGSEFKDAGHHQVVANVDGKHYGYYKGVIYKSDSHGNIARGGDGMIASEARVLDISITKNVFVILIMSAFLIFIFSRVAKSYKSGLTPTGAAKFLEPIIIFVRDEIAKPNIGEKHYKRFMSFLLTVFFFIWFMNLAGLMPLGINVTGNFAVTSSIAVLVFIITQVSGTKHYWGHMFWMPGVPVPMKIAFIPIELIGLVVKPFALMIRLYANILAGHIVIGSILSLIIVAGSFAAGGAFSSLTLVLSVLELLVAALQAYIFTMLAALYFGSAVDDGHH